MQTIDIERMIGIYLNTYLFDHTWNLPHSEYRNNLIARCISSHPVINCVLVDTYKAILPNRQPYYVYTIPKVCLCGVNVDVPVWTTLESFVNSGPVDLRVTGSNGEWLHRGSIYIINHPCEDEFIMVVNANMTKRSLAANYDFKKIYLSVYYDSDPNRSVRVQCFTPINVAQRNAAYDASKGATLVFINGREAQPASVLDILVGDYIEIVKDSDVVAELLIDLNDPNQNRYYRSVMDTSFKYLIHIPKELNPDNLLITHNTCDIFIRPNFIANARLKGMFVHRFNTKRAINQVTHNDFAISETLLNAYKDFIGTTEITIRVLIRKHAKQKRLIREADYISMLYQLPDNEILDFLEGNGSRKLPFWTAAHLEASKYIEAMLAIKSPENSYQVKRYVEMLGYYNTISLLCKRITRTTLSKDNTRTFTVDLPIALLHCNKVNAIVSFNGLKLNSDDYTTLRAGQYVTISLHEAITITPGDKLVIELFPADIYRAEHFIPSKETSSIVSGVDNFDIYLVRDLTADPLKRNHFTEKYKLDLTYEKLTDLTNICDIKDNKITFKDTQYGKMFLISAQTMFMRVLNQSFTLTTLDKRSITTGPIQVSTKMFKKDKEVVYDLPLIHPDTFALVYLNGRELVEGVDYSFVTETARYGVACKVIHVNNSEYLSSSENNTLEVFVTRDKSFAQEYGFFVDKTIGSLNTLLYWYSDLTMLTGDGRALKDVNQVNGYITVEDNVREGAIYYMRAMVPEKVHTYIPNDTLKEDTERCMQIIEYFRGRVPRPIQDFVITPNSHHIYSLIMNEIIKDALSGDLKLYYDADIQNMMKQVIKYTDCKDQDTALSSLAEEIIVAGAGSLFLNQPYKMNDTSAKGNKRTWTNVFSKLTIFYNPNNKQWELVSILGGADKRPYYFAKDSKGNKDPWLLAWELGPLGIDPIPAFSSENINLKFIDILPTYRLNEVYTPELYLSLEQIKRGLLPTDGIVDIRTDVRT